MKHKIQIIDLGNGYYSFITDNFSSFNHFVLCSNVKSMYKYAWDAYKDAKKMLVKYPHHLNALRNQKYAIDEYSDLLVTDISADEMLTNHYKELYSSFEDRAKGLPKDDSDEAEILYGEIKGVVGELLKVKEEMEKDSEKSGFDAIIQKLSKLTKKYLNSFLLKDAKEEESKETEQEAVGEEQAEQADEGLGGDGGVGGPEEISGLLPSAPMSNAPTAMNKNTFIKMASRKISIKSSEIKDIMEHYCDRICNSMKTSDSSIIGNIDIANRTMTIKNSNGPMLSVNVNKNLMIDGIFPLGVTSQIYPSGSLKFYQKYWKPVVEAVGHCYLPYIDGDKHVIFTSHKLPDMPKTLPLIKNVQSWNCTKSKEDNLAIEFRQSNSMGFETWHITPSQITKTASEDVQPSKYTEENYFKDGVPAMVICNAPKLPSINKKIGKVVKVFPLETGLIAQIDFGNNIMVYLREENFEIFDVDNPPSTEPSGTEKIHRHKDEV